MICSFQKPRSSRAISATIVYEMTVSRVCGRRLSFWNQGDKQTPRPLLEPSCSTCRVDQQVYHALKLRNLGRLPPRALFGAFEKTRPKYHRVPSACNRLHLPYAQLNKVTLVPKSDDGRPSRGQAGLRS